MRRRTCTYLCRTCKKSNGMDESTKTDRARRDRPVVRTRHLARPGHRAGLWLDWSRSCAMPPKDRRWATIPSEYLRWLLVSVAAGLVACGGHGCVTVREFFADQHVARGERLMERQDLEAALAEFEEATRLAPQLAVAHSKMGTIYRRLGEFEAAIACFVEAVRRDPFSFDDTFNLAQLYHFTQRLKDAIQAYLHAVELRPESFDAQLNLGVCYQQAGQLDQAIERYEKAIEVDPVRPHAYVNLGVALDTQGKLYEAVRAYKEALERDSGQPVVLVNLAQAYMKQDRLKIARQALEEAIALDPHLAAAHEAMGYCLFRLREFDAAEQAYQRALACDWHLARAHAGLGSINMLRYLEDPARREGRDRAIEHWHRSLELDPDQPRIRKLIAEYKPEAVDPEDALLEELRTP